MFGHIHYVPLLRSKFGELRALNALPPEIRRFMTPIIEFLPTTFAGCSSREDVEKVLEKLTKQFTSWRGQRVFLDFSPLRWDHHRLLETGTHPINEVCEGLRRQGVWPVPLLTLKMAHESTLGRSIADILRRHGTGACLRVSPAELAVAGGAQGLVGRRLSQFGLSAKEVDLIVDRCAIERTSVPFSEFAPAIPGIDDWNSLTVLAGSFPPDLSRLAKAQVHHLRRHEWTHWEAIKTLWRGRKPAFGDYTIQHVNFKEPVEFANFSASVRYTLEDHVLVLRGEGVFNPGGPGFEQWNGWAKYLVTLPDYFGSTFSAGDAYAAERARIGASPGSAQAWLQAGFSHHMTVASWQVRGLLDAAKSRHQAAAAAVAVALPEQAPTIH